MNQIQGTPTSKKFTEKHTEVAEKMYSLNKKNSNKIFKIFEIFEKKSVRKFKKSKNFII